jgi:DNA-binding transcriptional regulator YdaS (Cro superfamily)
MTKNLRKKKIQHLGKLKGRMHNIKAIEDVVKYCGGIPADLARESGVSWQTVKLWLTGKSIISAERAVALEEITKGKVTREALRPDIFKRRKIKNEVGAR